MIDYRLMIMVVHLQSFHGDTNQLELKDYMKNYLLRYEFINKTVINYLVDLTGEKALYHTLHSGLFIFIAPANTYGISSTAAIRLREGGAAVGESAAAFRQCGAI